MKHDLILEDEILLGEDVDLEGLSEDQETEIVSEGEDFDEDFDSEDEDDFEDEDLSESTVARTAEGDLIIESVLEEYGLLAEDEEDAVLSESDTVVKYKLNKKQKFNRATKKAAYVLAKEANDSDYKKLAKLNKQRAQLKAKIARKYQNQARQRVREMQRERGKTMKDMPAINPNAKAE
jgi:hypothetical protein